MKCLVIVVLAIVACSQAIPYGMGMGGGGYNRGESGYGRGGSGYQNNGYGNSGISEGHNRGHHESDFASSVRGHESSAHDIGGMNAGNRYGNNNAGYGDYGNGYNRYGNGYNNYGPMGYY